MYFYVMLFMLLTSSIAFAETTINATIELGNHFFPGSLDGLLGNKNFPSQSYQIHHIHTKNFSLVSSTDKGINLKPYDTVQFNAKLDLIYYDKIHDYYKFKLTLVPGMVLENSKTFYSYSNRIDKQVNAGSAKIYFAENNQDSMIIEGRFNHKYSKRKNGESYYPDINKSGTGPFILSSNELKFITISSQHNIPVIIKFNYKPDLLYPERL